MAMTKSFDQSATAERKERAYTSLAKINEQDANGEGQRDIKEIQLDQPDSALVKPEQILRLDGGNRSPAYSEEEPTFVAKSDFKSNNNAPGPQPDKEEARAVQIMQFNGNGHNEKNIAGLNRIEKP